MATRSGKPLLSRDDWARAALRAIERGGVKGVAVDRLAKEFETTRGSFYWHFHDRDDLIAAALELWERENTTDRLGVVLSIDDPLQRLKAVVAEVYERPVDEIEVTLVSEAHEPPVAAVFARVTQARLDVLRSTLVEVGLPEAEAERRAWLAYALYLGHHQLLRNPDLAARGPASMQFVIRLLTSP
ncbi:TetR/AcrR family transcriptional regulator [Agromyces sp. NPDC049794]|uniref:TetR/AcrR family transcriptional regulator n=1 Tax=unclassified Agromyces TaxID=2639701 RepID=UPI0033EB4CA2